MEELKELLKHNVDGNKSGLQDQVLSILHNEAEINALITWIKVNSVAKNVSSEEVIKEAQNIRRIAFKDYGINGLHINKE